MNKKERRIIIGDVHGYYDGVIRLLNKIKPDGEDQIYFLGDLIDRGPDSNKIVTFVRRGNYKCIRGNHEQMLIDSFSSISGKVNGQALQAWLYAGGQTTVTSYGKHGIPQEDLEWIRNLPTYFDLGDIWLVHAGIDPQLPLTKQNEHQFCWIRDEFHRMSEPYFPDKLIITGHTMTFTFHGVLPGKLASGNGWLDIDTGAYHPKSGWLTALDIDNRQVYQVNVFNKKERVLSLDEATTKVKISPFRLPRQK